MLVNTITSTNCTPQTIVIGRRATHDTLQIVFDLAYLIENYGDGTAVLAVKRSQDESAYPAVVTQEDNTLTWTVSETDTYYVGSGECQLMWYVDGGLAKTIIYPMVVMRDILSTAEEPPDGYENWIEHLTGLGAETQQNAQNAAQSASEAGQAKDDAVNAKEASEEAARKAAAASVHAPIIQNGFWYIWNDDQYVNTNVRAEGEKGDKGDTGEKGDTGNGIASITKTGTSGLVDTYTVTYTDGTSITFTVTNGAKGDKGDTGATGNGIASIAKTGTSGNVDTYTITYTNGQTVTFTVTNGAVSSVAGKTGAVVLDSGDIGYDSTETYTSGTAGAALNDLNRHLSDTESALTELSNDYTETIDGESKPNIAWDFGTVAMNSSGWTYYTYPNHRVHTREGNTIPLTAGQVVGLSNPDNHTFQLGWLNEDGIYKNNAPSANDYTIRENGEYIVMILTTNSVIPANPDDYGKLFVIKGDGLAKRVDEIENDLSNILTPNKEISGESIEDLSIALEKLTDITHGWNLVAPSDFEPWTWVGHGIVSNKIPVNDDTTYTISYVPTGVEQFNPFHYIRFYDSNNVQVGQSISYGGYSGGKTFSVPVGAVSFDLYCNPNRDAEDVTEITDLMPTNIILVHAQNSSKVYEPYREHIKVNCLPDLPYNVFAVRDRGFVTSVAHRGLSYYYPGNTKEAIIGAAKYGFNTVEIDIQFSSDMVPILVHESTLNVVTDGALTGAPSQYTYAELSADGIEWGTWFDKSMTGVKLLSLEEAINICHKLNLEMLLDVKVAPTVAHLEIIYNLLAKYGMIDHATWIYGSGLIFQTGLNIEKAGFATGSPLPDGWCESVAQQIEQAGYTGTYTIFQDINSATLEEGNLVRSYGWNYAIYFANTVEQMNACLENFGVISMIESDRFTISEAMARYYGIGWTDIPNDLMT